MEFLVLCMELVLLVSRQERGVVIVYLRIISY